MVSNKRVRTSLRGRIKGMEGWEGGELEGRIKGVGRWRGGWVCILHPSPTADNTTTYIQLSSKCSRVREQVHYEFITHLLFPPPRGPL